MTKLQFDALFTSPTTHTSTPTHTFHPLPGKCAILLDPVEEKVGSVIVPETARGRGVKAGGYKGRVLAMTPVWEDGGEVDAMFQRDEGFKVGDHVLLGLHLDELTEEVVFAWNNQVEAVLEY